MYLPFSNVTTAGCDPCMVFNSSTFSDNCFSRSSFSTMMSLYFPNLKRTVPSSLLSHKFWDHCFFVCDICSVSAHSSFLCKLHWLLSWNSQYFHLFNPVLFLMKLSLCFSWSLPSVTFSWLLFACQMRLISALAVFLNSYKHFSETHTLSKTFLSSLAPLSGFLLLHAIR